MAQDTNVITAPSNGTEFLSTESFTVSADIADSDGINSVRLWQDDGSTSIVIDVLNDAPFDWNVGPLSEGQYEFYTRKKDTLGNLDNSDRIAISIVNAYSRITSPSAGLSLNTNDTLQITAEAGDVDGIASVSLWGSAGGGAPQSLGNDNSAPYQWDVTSTAAGDVSYFVRVTDSQGGVRDSDPLTVNFVDGYNIIISPDEGATFTDVESFMVTAEVQDPNGIASVEFWIDDGSSMTKAGEVSSPPYSWEFAQLSAGTYAFVTRSIDDLNNVTDSAPVIVTITPDDGTGDGTFPTMGSTVVITATVNNKYVSADNPNNELIANKIEIGPMEQFEIIAQSGDYFALKCVGNGKFVVAESGGNASLRADRDGVGNWEQFRFTESLNRIGLVAKANDLWVTADNVGNAPLIANRDRQGGWESFIFDEVSEEGSLFPPAGSIVAFIASVNGRYVSAANPDNELIANRDQIGEFEKFEVIQHNADYVVLRCLGNDRYVVADSGGTGNLKANRTAIGNWEQFQFAESNGSMGLIAKANSKWVSARSSGSAPLLANRDTQGGWESFTYTIVTNDPDPDPEPDPDPDPEPDPDPDPEPDPDPDPNACGDPVSNPNLPFDQSKLNVGPMVGHTTDSSALIWVLPKNTSNVKVYYKKQGTSATYSYPMNKEENDDASYRATIECLSANTTYEYDVVVDNNRIIASGSFTTAPAPTSSGSKFSFAFTSCGKHADDSVQSGWVDIANVDPSFVLYLGDTIYTNAASLSEYNRSYVQSKTMPSLSNLIKDYPFYTCWDDHDYGGNNGNKDTSREGVPGNTLRNIALNAFKDNWANPYPDDAHSNYYSFTWGDVEFFVLDNRYNRTSHFGRNDSKYFGDQQMNWLKNKLQNSTATFKILCQGGGYNGGTSNGEGFFGYPAEFQGLRNFIIDNSIDGVLHLSGDIHKNQLRLADTGDKDFGDYPAWDIISSGIGRSNKRDIWAKIDIDTTISDPTLKVTFYQDGQPTQTSPSDKDFILSVTEYTLRASELQNN